MNTKSVLTALIATLLLAACGNSGPLVLPDKPDPAGQQQPADGASDADDGNGGDNDG